MFDMRKIVLKQKYVLTSFFILAAFILSFSLDIQYISASESPENLTQNTSEKKAVKIGKGDTLLTVLNDTGVDKKQAHAAIASLKKSKYAHIPRDLQVGEHIYIAYAIQPEDNVSQLEELTLPLSFGKDLVIKKDQDRFDVFENHTAIETHYLRREVIISNSLYVDGKKAGLPDQALAEFVKQLSYEIDFQRDLQEGDLFEVVIEQSYDPFRHKKAYQGLVYARMQLKDRVVEIFRHEDKNNRIGYFNAKGESTQKTFLRTPMDAFKITSKFGMRKHPILGYSRMHKGVDFAAPQGTPIFAAGDAVVSFVGRKGGYGNYVLLKHDSGYATAYGHLSRYAKGLKKGKKVKQGDVIGYVGSTGQATGPHLHYELLKGNQQINPLKITLAANKKLDAAELKRFKKTQTEVASIRNTLPAKTRIVTLK